MLGRIYLLSAIKLITIFLSPFLTERNRLLWLILLVAMLPRIMLGTVNHDANDNHIDVVNILVDQQRIPEKNECWSCYQPKLYYLACAGVVKLLGLKTELTRIQAMQGVNILLSFFILLLFLKFIAKLNLAYSVKCTVFALFAFNPCLVGINVQGTNDTMAIFWGMLAVYLCHSFFKKMSGAKMILLSLVLLAGMLSKASIIVLTGAIIIAFLLKIASGTERQKILTYLLPMILFLLLLVPWIGGYYANYTKYHSLSISTWEEYPAPHFFEKTYVERPGLESIYDGVFSFYLRDMVRQPYINNELDNYPIHRTSLWSQLYGRTVFMHFDQWPPRWQSHRPEVLWVGKMLILLGCVPLLLFCAGFLINTVKVVSAFVKRHQMFFASPTQYFHWLVVIAFLCSSVYYTCHYRDFSSMKSIYIFPGLLSFMKILTDGFAIVKSKLLMLFVQAVLSLVVLLSLADIWFLYYDLLNK